MKLTTRLAAIPLLAALFALAAFLTLPHSRGCADGRSTRRTRTQAPDRRVGLPHQIRLSGRVVDDLQKVSDRRPRRQKQLGYVKGFTVYAPSLHTSEDSRWDYRVIIVRIFCRCAFGPVRRRGRQTTLSRSGHVQAR